jgi:hypothetical protein
VAFSNPCKEQLLSFFDDDEDAAPRPSARAATPRTRPSPRRPQPARGARAGDQHTLMVRRRVAAGIGLVLIVIIVLGINSCLNGRKESALKDYNQHVGQIAQASAAQVSHPLFSTLASASSKSPLDVEVQVDQLRIQAQNQANQAKGLSVPGDMVAAQRDFLLTLDLRAEALVKLASQVRSALGGQGKSASSLIAGDMEMFIASDVIYAQRTAPLIAQTLSANGIHEPSASASVFLPNVGWLDPNTVLSRLTGQAAGSSTNSQIAPGVHGHSLTGVSVGAQNLQPSPALNHISGTSNPTFTVMVLNGGTNVETNVKVEVTVTGGGKTLKGSRVINKTEPNATAKVDIPVTGVMQGVASRVTAYIQPVPGETNTENNKGTFLAVFGQ